MFFSIHIFKVICVWKYKKFILRPSLMRVKKYDFIADKFSIQIISNNILILFNKTTKWYQKARTLPVGQLESYPLQGVLNVQ